LIARQQESGLHKTIMGNEMTFLTTDPPKDSMNLIISIHFGVIAR